MAIPFIGILGFVKNYWDEIALIAVGVAIAGVLALVWLRGSHWENKYHKERAAHEETRGAHNLAVANAAMETARAERIERDKEQALQEAAEAARRKDAEVQAFWTNRVAELNGRDGDRRKQLLDHIARLTNHIGTGETGKDSISTIVSLQDRLATCGQFLGRADDIAERASIRYGEVRNLWDECARDAKAIRETVQ